LRGTLPADFLVPIQVQELDDEQLVVVALAENLARKEQHPLDEGEALLKVLRKDGRRPRRGEGVTDAVARSIGRTPRWVQTRVAFAERLTAAVKQAWREDRITVAHARELLPCSPEEQNEFLEQILEYEGDLQPGDIADSRQDELPSLAVAIFPLSSYPGDVIGEETSDLREQFFADRELFLSLQEAAIDQLVADLQGRHPWVAVERNAEWLNSTKFRRSTSAEAGAVVLVLPDLRVQVFEGFERIEPPRPQLVKSTSGGRAAGVPTSSGRAALTSRPYDEEEEIEGQDLDAAEDPPEDDETSTPGEDSAGPVLTTSHLIDAHRLKSQALQAALTQQPVHALRLACLALLGRRTACGLRAEPPAANDRSSTPAVAEVYATFSQLLPLGTLTAETQFPGASRLYDDDADGTPRRQDREIELWEALVRLTDGEVVHLFAALLAPYCGSFTGWAPALGDRPPVLALARTLGLHQGAFQELTDDWLRRYRKAALVEVAVACGAVAPDGRKSLAKLRLDEIRARILDSPTRNSSWVPPELMFLPDSEVQARFADVPKPSAEGEAA
ncbi:MAG: hypothetical protein JF614_32400, partial [Acidobacteria bacterium]|nr:hypothetical protein [Acidobacteriota bacterium]